MKKAPAPSDTNLRDCWIESSNLATAFAEQFTPKVAAEVNFYMGSYASLWLILEYWKLPPEECRKKTQSLLDEIHIFRKEIDKRTNRFMRPPW